MLKRAAFVAAGLVAGVALLLIGELVLRIAGPDCRLESDPFAGFSNVVPMFEPGVRPEGTQVLRTTAPHRSAGSQEFLAEKPAGGFRAFVVGESSAAGIPYPRSEAFSGWLERRLRAELPDVPVEVVNAAHSGYASRRIAAVTDEIAAYEPDLLIVYCGHNEYGERRFYSHLLDMDPRLFWLWELLARTRLYCLLTRAVGGSPDGATPRPEFEFNHLENAAEMFTIADERLHGDVASERELGWEELHYRRNLERMAETMRGVGARTVFVTLSQNFSDWAPASSSHRADLGVEERAAYDRAVAAGDALARDASGCGAALAAWERALAIDDTVADLHWRKAGCERALGRLDEARESYRRASDLDRVPHGAPTRFNEVLREVARSTDSLLVDAYAALAEESGAGLVGDDLFTDMMHPNLRAHQRIARALAEALRAADLPRPAAEWKAGAYEDPDPASVLASAPRLRVQEHLVRSGACLLAWREECADREAAAALAIDLQEPTARKIRDGLARRRLREQREGRSSRTPG
jgi:lysophospholipase L1-like esterase